MATGESEQKPVREGAAPGGGRRRGFGRAKGTPNKLTRTVKEAARALTLGNPKVFIRLRNECESGSVDPSVFNKLLEYGYGKPKVTVEVSVEESPTRALAATLRAALTKEERMVLAELTRKTLVSARVVEQLALPPVQVLGE